MKPVNIGTALLSGSLKANIIELYLLNSFHSSIAKQLKIATFCFFCNQRRLDSQQRSSVTLNVLTEGLKNNVKISKTIY